MQQQLCQPLQVLILEKFNRVSPTAIEHWLDDKMGMGYQSIDYPKLLWFSTLLPFSKLFICHTQLHLNHSVWSTGSNMNPIPDSHHTRSPQAPKTLATLHEPTILGEDGHSNNTTDTESRAPKRGGGEYDWLKILKLSKDLGMPSYFWERRV